MKNKLIQDETDGNRKWVLAFSKGDEVVSQIKEFVDENDITCGNFTAIGAFRKAILYYFDWESKEYKNIPVDEQTEVLALVGNVGRKDGKVKLHMHVTLGRRDGSVRGGHLKEATVRPTLELFLDEQPETLQRSKDEESGLALIDL